MTASAVSNRQRGGRSGSAVSKRSSAMRSDRDGDVSMGAGAATRGGKIGKTTRSPRPQTSDNLASRVQRPGFQRQLMAAVQAGNNQRGKPQRPTHLKQLKITGWRESTAASNDDGGVGALIKFIESRVNKANVKKHMGTRLPKNHPTFKIDKHTVHGDELIIYVPPNEARNILRLNDYKFAGVNIKVHDIENENGTKEDVKEDTSGAMEMKQMFQEFLNQRYDGSTKLLNLSALGQDQTLNSIGMFESASTQSKFFPALMKVCTEFLKTPEERRENVHSVTLANNTLDSLTVVTTLAQTFPDLLNLDLSNNSFPSMESLTAWRNKFRNLDHLVINNNPLEQKDPNYKDQLLKWFPKLRMLNGEQVRSEQEIAVKELKSEGKLALPVLPASFEDEAQIAENFLKNFFPAYDGDRAALANQILDATSKFSFSVNTAAPRDDSHASATQPQEWDQYIKRSRNLRKLNHLPARMAREFVGVEAIANVWTSLPVTRHPAFDPANLNKWMIESTPVPGVPDPNNAIQHGVGGLMITAHGEFEEAPGGKLRSFDRTFILGPGGPAGVRVVSDMMTLRAYGGIQGFVPTPSA